MLRTPENSPCAKVAVELFHDFMKSEVQKIAFLNEWLKPLLLIIIPQLVHLTYKNVKIKGLV